MKRFFDPRQLDHAPLRELHNGEWMPYSETPARAEQVIAAIGETEVARDFGMDGIAAVHDQPYLDFLQNAHRDWHAAGRVGDAIGYTLPVVRRRPLDCSRIDARLGAYSMDAGTPISAGTWDAAYWAAQTALTGLDAIAAGERHAFALCRPPGHHAGSDYMGGYCYLNNAAIAAREAGRIGLGPVAVLDVDYHHGNGTQDIFYEDGEVFFASIHADPRTDFPFYWGHADERGAGAGQGTTLNLPLPQGTGWSAYAAALNEALDTIDKWGTKPLVLSFGADTYAGDPISSFALQTEDFTRMGRTIADRGLPVLIVMEGGYAVGDLGGNVAALLNGFAQA